MRINKSLKVLFTLNSTFVFASSLLGPLYAIYIKNIDDKIVSVSLSWAVFMFSSTVFVWFVSNYGDRVKEQEFLLAGGFLVRSLAWIGYIFVSDLTGVIVLQVVLGLGEALGTPSWNAIFARHLDEKKEIMEYSSWNIVSNLVVGVATIIGGIVVTYFGFNTLFIVMGALAMLSFVGVLILPRDVL